jgi:signal transduction histidine kinase
MTRRTPTSWDAWLTEVLARLGVRTPFGRDALLAVALAVLGLCRLLPNIGDDLAGRPDLIAALVGANVAATADVATIAIRRRLPRTALVVATVVVLASTLLPARYINTGIGVFVCAYTVAALLPGREAIVLLVACAAAHAVGGIVAVANGGQVVELLTFWGNDGTDTVNLVWASVGTFGIAGLVGSYVQTRRAYTAELVARAQRLEREREERARLAVVEERAHIARELHDVAAHDLSAIVVQAGAADRQVEHDPDAAKATLRMIRTQGRETMTALRQLVGIVRDPETETDDRKPQPSLVRLDDLLTGARDAGMVIEVTTSGEAIALSAPVDQTAYRVVQEALTNARRHAPGAPVSIAISYAAEAVCIVVENPVDDSQHLTASASDHHGLLGMRERVQLLGGTLSVGVTAGGLWRVEAMLPRRPLDGR